MLVHFFYIALVILAGHCLANPESVQCHDKILLVKLGDQFSLKTPNFPEAYPKGQDKNQCISSPPGTKLKLNCSYVEMGDCRRERDGMPRGDYMYVSLNEARTNSDLQWFCGSWTQGFEPQLSDSNSIQVGFHSELVQGKPKAGYDCTVTVVREDGTLPPHIVPGCPQKEEDICTGNRVELATIGDWYHLITPNYPDLMPENGDGLKCISSPNGTRLELTCSHFDMSQSCPDGANHMYVAWAREPTTRIESTIRCGSTFTPITSDYHEIIVGYHSNNLWGRQTTGFDCAVTVIGGKETPVPTTTHWPTITTIASTIPTTTTPSQCHGVQLTQIGDTYNLKTPSTSVAPPGGDNFECVNSPEGTKLELTCSYFDMGPTCDILEDGLTYGSFYMYLSVEGHPMYQGFPNTYQCGSTFTPVTSVNNAILVGWHINSGVGGHTGYDCIATVVGESTATGTTETPIVATTTTDSTTTVAASAPAPPLTAAPPATTAAPTQRQCSGVEMLGVGDQLVLQTPNVPAPIPSGGDNFTCLNSPQGTNLQVTCSYFDMGPTCVVQPNGKTFGSFYMYYSLEGYPNSLYTYQCGSRFTPITSVSNAILVGWHANKGAARTGYSCVVTVVDGALATKFGLGAVQPLKTGAVVDVVHAAVTMQKDKNKSVEAEQEEREEAEEERLEEYEEEKLEEADEE